ncbi:nucleolar transcription factor 1-B-like [Glycine soja]|uniref:Uncharacterized protein n=1 Tax=Glycine soja TaxID=3848 RepID=A0A0B2RZ74_GLYSO|nr:nucleolar transcription factor 1-B-like [Glycine soja]KHN37187.1 hypothetical protein glysoja_037311 [Glycine soja]RZC09013.1 hypothetical protein D0Y65_015644 [Glycine soja]
MAKRTLLKLKPSLHVPLRFFRSSTLALTRPLGPLARPESPSISLFKPSTVHFPGILARQMVTARSPRGASKRNDEEEEDDDDDDDGFDDEDGFDLDDEFDDSDDGDGFDDEEEEEKPKGKKKKTW